MKARNLITAFFLFLAYNFAIGQENYLWPIPGKQAGEGILFRPQDYIGVADAQTQAELNFGDLIIGAPLGTPVLCPVDGKIHSALLGYRNSWSCSLISFAQQTGNYEQDSLLFLEWDNMTQEKIHNTSLSVALLGVFGLVQRYATGMAHRTQIQRLSWQTSDFGKRLSC